MDIAWYLLSEWDYQDKAKQRDPGGDVKYWALASVQF